MLSLIVTAFVSADCVVDCPRRRGGDAGSAFREVPFEEAANEVKGQEQWTATTCSSSRSCWAGTSNNRTFYRGAMTRLGGRRP